MIASDVTIRHVVQTTLNAPVRPQRIVIHNQLTVYDAFRGAVPLPHIISNLLYRPHYFRGERRCWWFTRSSDHLHDDKTSMFICMTAPHVALFARHIRIRSLETVCDVSIILSILALLHHATRARLPIWHPIGTRRDGQQWRLWHISHLCLVKLQLLAHIRKMTLPFNFRPNFNDEFKSRN